MTPLHLVLSGPPGVGKSAVGRRVAELLDRPFVDADAALETRWGRPIGDYFARGDEALFRAREAALLRELTAGPPAVLAPGGGALLNPKTRAWLEAHAVIIGLTAPLDTLLARLAYSHPRPLLAEHPRLQLAALLEKRAGVYAAAVTHINTENRSIDDVAAAALTAFNAHSQAVLFTLGDARAYFGVGLLATLPDKLAAHGLRPPFIVISESVVAPLHGERVAQRLNAPLVTFPAGEAHKNLDTARDLYTACLRHNLERGGTLVAVGGGVAGDVTGFVAATVLRGVNWVNVPTTVLAMADASLGGKVGVDVPEGKNLVGAFHPPRLTLSDFETLATLPALETRCGLAEIIKAAIIADPALFEQLRSPEFDLPTAIVRGAAVKVGVVNADPLEKGERATLNLGHTLGHAVEAVSGYTLKHGECVALGLVAEARLAERLGLAGPGLANTIAEVVRAHQLPTTWPNYPRPAILSAMRHDKKKSAGQVKFALPRAIGDVAWGVPVPDEAIF